MNYSQYFYIYMVSIGINIVMTVILICKRRSSGAVAMIAVLLCCSLWSFGSAMETGVYDIANKFLWVKISYSAHTFGPVAWFIMILQLTENQKWTSRRNILLLSTVPAITSVLAITNFHGLMWLQSRLLVSGSLTVLSFTYGPWFWIHMVYATVLDLLSATMAIRFWRKQAPYFGRRYACLVFPVLIVWLVNTAYLFKLGSPVDLTPIAWGASTPFIFWALFRDKLFDFVPIARYHVMENISSGIVLMDLKNRVVDLNPASAELFECRPDSSVGVEAHEFFRDWPDLLRQLDGNANQIEFRNSQSDNYYVSSCYEIKQKEIVLGRMFIIRDVTKERRIQSELLDTQRRMVAQDERERMARDLHDDMGQILGFVNVQTQAISEYIRNGRLDEASKCLIRLSEVSRDAHDHVRETILTMRGETEEKEMTAAMYLRKLEQMMRLFERNSGIQVRMKAEGIDSLRMWNFRPAMQLSKIVREALNNIREHSGATEVLAIFEENFDTLIVTVSDNGCGFDTAAKASDSHYGLLFMQERAKEMGGWLSISSKSGKGTSVEFRLPLSAIALREKLKV